MLAGALLKAGKQGVVLRTVGHARRIMSWGANAPMGTVTALGLLIGLRNG
jgi:hypothetical protein